MCSSYWQSLWSTKLGNSCFRGRTTSYWKYISLQSKVDKVTKISLTPYLFNKKLGNSLDIETESFCCCFSILMCLHSETLTWWGSLKAESLFLAPAFRILLQHGKGYKNETHWCIHCSEHFLTLQDICNPRSTFLPSHLIVKSGEAGHRDGIIQVSDLHLDNEKPYQGTESGRKESVECWWPQLPPDETVSW